MTQLNFQNSNTNVKYHLDVDWTTHTITYFVGYKGRLTDSGTLRFKKDGSIYSQIGKILLQFADEKYYEDNVFIQLPIYPF